MNLIQRTVGRLFAAPQRTSAKSSASYYTSEHAVDSVFNTLMGVEDPDSVLRSLGLPRHGLARLYADDEIAAAMDTRRDAVLSTPWRLEPGVGGPIDFIWMEMEAHAHDLLRGAFSALPFGYSVLETTYAKRDDGRIGIDRVQEKPMEWFEPQRDGSLVWLCPDGRRETLDTEAKFLLTRRLASWKNPYGEALFSRLYWAWFCRHNTWKFWVKFLERFGDPLLIGKSYDAAKMVEELKKLGVTNLVAVGKDDDLQQVTPSGSSEFEKVELALSRRIQKMILGQTLTSEVTSGGSYAAAKVQNEVREDKRNADLRMIRATMQRQVNALWALNRFPGPAPQFIFADNTGIEVERAERDAKLVGAGIVRLTKKYLLRVYDFEEGDIEIPEQQTPPADIRRNNSEPTLLPSRGAALLAARRARFSDGQEAIERGVSEALELSPASPIPLAAVRRAVAAATDEQDLIRRLSLLFDEEDERFSEVLARAIFAAEVFGYVVADDQTGNPSRKRASRKREGDAQ